MKGWRLLLLLIVTVAIFVAVCTGILIRRGFSARSEPSSIEKVLARPLRNLAIPSGSRHEKNPWSATPGALNEAREHFMAHCAICHGNDGRGQTQLGRSLYPRVPDLLSPQTQNLTDGEIHYIIANGVQLTGMPGWSTPHQEMEDDSLLQPLWSPVAGVHRGGR
jgi:mono/diheme cytochrome c family protein